MKTKLKLCFTPKKNHPPKKRNHVSLIYNWLVAEKDDDDEIEITKLRVSFIFDEFKV